MYAVLAYHRHVDAGSTTPREDAAAELGLEPAEFRIRLDRATSMGFRVN